MESSVKKTILWIEDDKLLGRIVSDKFTDSRCDLMLVETGEEALSALDRFVPDGIVVDLLLGNGMSGFEILKKLKDDERFKNVPLMVLSNLSKPQDKEMARKLGVERFFVKASLSLEDTVKEMSKLCL